MSILFCLPSAFSRVEARNGIGTSMVVGVAPVVMGLSAVGSQVKMREAGGILVVGVDEDDWWAGGSLLLRRSCIPMGEVAASSSSSSIWTSDEQEVVGEVHYYHRWHGKTRVMLGKTRVMLGKTRVVPG